MQYTHHLMFFDKHRKPLALTEAEVTKLRASTPLPQMIWIRGSCYNSASIEGIVKIPQVQTVKCERCHEYKPVNDRCPRCSELTPEQRAKGREAFDKMRKDFAKKFGWGGDYVPDEEPPKNCKACDITIEDGEYCAVCKPAYEI